jgi:hypothetical protein
VLYVDAAAHATGDGSRNAPFASLAEVETASAAGDVIVLMPSAAPYRGGIALKDGQTLAGAGAAVLRALGVEAQTGVATIVAEGRPAVVLAKDVVIAGLALTSSSGATISGSPSGHVRVIAVVVTASGGTAVKIDGGDGELTFEASPVQATGASAIEIRDSATAVSLGPIDVDAAGGNSAVILHGVTAGFTLSGGTIRNTSGPAVAIDGADGVTIRELQLTNDANRNGVSAQTCGSDVRGGPIAACNASLFVQNAKNVSLEKLVVDGSAQLGIGAENVNGLRLSGVEVKNAGNEMFESGVVLRNVSGDVVFTGCTFQKSAAREVHIENTRGEARVHVDHCTFAGGGGVNAQQNLLAGASGNASLSLDIAASTFTAGAANALHVTAAGASRVTLRVASSTFDRVGSAVLVGASSTAKLDYNIERNHIFRSSLGAINVSASGDSVVHGTISGNDIGRSGEAGSGATCGRCIGMVLTSNLKGQHSADVKGNTIQQIDGAAIRAVSGDAGDLRLSIQGNILREPIPGADTAAIEIQAGTSKKDTASVCVDIGGTAATANVISGKWSPANPPITLWNRFPGTAVKLAGFRGDGKNAAVVQKFVARKNRNAGVLAKLTADPAGNAFGAGERCVTP